MLVLLSVSITCQGWAPDVLGAAQLDEHLAAAPRLQGAAVAGEAGHAAGEATCDVLQVCHVSRVSCVTWRGYLVVVTADQAMVQ